VLFRSGEGGDSEVVMAPHSASFGEDPEFVRLKAIVYSVAESVKSLVEKTGCLLVLLLFR